MSLKDVLKMMAELEPEELDALVKTMTAGAKQEPVTEEVEITKPKRRTKKGGNLINPMKLKTASKIRPSLINVRKI